MIKPFKELDLSNAFLFDAAMADNDTCKLVLEIILGRKLPQVQVHVEHSILISSDFRSVRFDVYACDEVRVNYNIEAQNENEHDLPKRSRYHQAEMDVAALKPGEKFSDLKPAYIIFVCTFDPFGKGLYRYTFENTCKECGIPLDDEATRIFLNTKGKNTNEVPKELIHFLNYMEHSDDAYVSQVNDTNISRLHKRVQSVKSMKEMEERYMTGEEMLEKREAKGLTEGAAQMVITFLSEKGVVPETLTDKILSEKDVEVIQSWGKLAARVSSVEEFEELI